MSNHKTAYEPVGIPEDLPKRSKPTRDDKGTNTSLAFFCYGSGLLAIIVASIAFWWSSRNRPLLLPLAANQMVQQNAKSMTFLWTMIGTILAFTTGALFNQLLKTYAQQRIADQGVKIGLIDFWTRVYSRKLLYDYSKGRILLTVFSVVFAIACGLLVSAYTGLVTPTYVYLQVPLSSSDLDFSSPAFGTWYEDTGTYLLDHCGKIKTYRSRNNDSAITLAMCPQLKDPLPYVAAGIASIESKYAAYDPTTNVLGMNFNGTTKGVLPHGWNTLPYFNSFNESDQPPVLNYNYSTIQQGVSAEVSCQTLHENSNITWSDQLELSITTTNGNNKEEVFQQNMTFGNEALGIKHDDNLLLSTRNFVATFENVKDFNSDEYSLELASYGTYKSHWKLPNITCVLAPHLTEVNVTYNNATGLFAGEVVGEVKGRIPGRVNGANNWLFRTTSTNTGNLIIDAIIALQNTPSYKKSLDPRGNVTIDWPRTLEMFLKGVTELHATRLRMILSAEINSTNVKPSGFKPVEGHVASWRLGYNGELAPIVTLLSLQMFLLVCAIFVVVMGMKTGVKRVSEFDPMNAAHLIVASAQGGYRGSLHALRSEDAIKADAKILDLSIEYRHMQGFQETRNLSNTDYMELHDHATRKGVEPWRLNSGMSGRM